MGLRWFLERLFKVYYEDSRHFEYYGTSQENKKGGDEEDDEEEQCRRTRMTIIFSQSCIYHGAEVG